MKKNVNRYYEKIAFVAMLSTLFINMKNIKRTII